MSNTDIIYGLVLIYQQRINAKNNDINEDLISKLLIDIPCLNIVRFNKKHYLICKNFDNNEITNPLTINIQKLKYKDGHYVPIIYII